MHMRAVYNKLRPMRFKCHRYFEGPKQESTSKTTKMPPTAAASAPPPAHTSPKLSLADLDL